MLHGAKYRPLLAQSRFNSYPAQQSYRHRENLMTPRTAARTDANQQEIVDALRKAGGSVALTHRVGSGFPDIVVGYGERNLLMEIKTPTGTLTPQEREFFALWRGDVRVIRTTEEAIRYMVDGE
jgi:hypothetical protein